MVAAGSQTLIATNVGNIASFAQPPGSPISVGSHPLYVASGDFNSDGYGDLAVANEYSNTVSILLGNGNGTFQTGGTYAVGQSPSCVAIGDLNHDGKSDLVVTDENSNNVSVLLGNGNGTFAASTTYAVGAVPLEVTVADFNGDDQSDIAITCYFSNGVSVLLANSNGTFQSAVTYSLGTFRGVVAGDFNRDGVLDLAVVNADGESVGVLLGNGNGTFQAASYYSAGLEPSQVVTADFNDDGMQDLAISDESGNNVSVLLGNGNGTFQAPAMFNVGANPTALAVGDFGGDGQQDLAAVDSTAGTLALLLGNGNGTFESAQYVNIGGSDAYSEAVAAVNRTGTLGLAISDFNASTVSIWLDQLIAGRVQVSVSPVAATHFAVTGPNGALAGNAVSFTVVAEDRFNNQATGYAGTVTFTSNNSATLLPAPSQLTSGAGTFIGTLAAVGNQTLTATDISTASITGMSKPIVVTYAASHFQVIVATTIVAGNPLTFNVTALDSLNETVVDYTGTVQFTCSDQQGTLPANAILNQGLGTFTATLITAGRRR